MATIEEEKGGIMELWSEIDSKIKVDLANIWEERKSYIQLRKHTVEKPLTPISQQTNIVNVELYQYRSVGGKNEATKLGLIECKYENDRFYAKRCLIEGYIPRSMVQEMVERMIADQKRRKGKK